MNDGLRFSVNVPATTANLGPGFDCMGLALNLHNQFTLEVGSAFGVDLSGEGSSDLPTGRDNAVVRAIQAVIDTVPAVRVPQDWRVQCHNRIPVASGLGSSASAIIAGLLLGNHLLEFFEPERSMTRTELLKLAVSMEGHADNVVPALFGGAWLCFEEGHTPPAIRLPVPNGLTFAVGVPNFPLQTTSSRRVLPPQVSITDAVYNVAQAARLTLALSSGHLELLKSGFGDRLHEPYRCRLIPGMEEIRRAALQAGAVAVTLSGAGPSILAWCTHSDVATKVAHEIRRAWRIHGVDAITHVLHPFHEPTTVTRTPEQSCESSSLDALQLLENL